MPGGARNRKQSPSMSLDSVTEYALSFSEDAVHLERRERDPGRQGGGGAPAAWRHLGSVDFTSSDFQGELARLRAMATGDGTGSTLPVTLIIPDDQILYTTLTVAPGADREHAVGRALDGLTPYAIEDLAFDWEGDGDSVRVAAVARQTLREARDFAGQYGFDGQGYCAVPEAGLYPGEPVFVLEPVPSARPRVDPAQAGVTASGLLIEEELPEEQPALDLDGDQSEAEEEVADESPVEPVPEESASTVAAEETDEPGEAVSVSEPAPSAEMIEDSEATEEVSREISGNHPAETPPADTPAALADDAQAAPQDEAGAVAGADDVPTAGAVEGAAPIQAPGAAETAAASEEAMSAAPRDVAAHDPAPQGPAPQADAGLNPRARAVHERAAGARQARPAGSAPVQPRRAGERGGLAGLIAMLGALVVGLILIWAFLVPDRQEAQLAAVTPSEQAPAPQPVEPVPAQTPEPAPAPEPTAPAEAETVQPEPAAPQRAATEPESAPAPLSALTEEERRRVLVAAAAVAAAVVPPSASVPTAPTSPPPASAASVQDGERAPAVGEAAQPAAAARPAATAPTPAAPAPAQAQARPAATPAQPAPAATRLTSSARPQLAPRRSTPQTSVPRADTAPRVPADPLPFEASQRRAQPVGSARPPERSRRAAPTPAATPVAAPAVAAPAQVQAQPAAAAGTAGLRGSARPPSRPEGSTPELPTDGTQADSLTPAEQQHLRDLIRDIGRGGLASLDPLPRGERLAQARPQRKPGTASDAADPSAIDAAVRSATTPPPDKPDSVETAAAPARDPGGLLRGSARPRARPAAAAGGGAAVSGGAVEAAISAAVAASPAPPGGVQLSALASSPLPPRRGERPPAAPEAAATPTPPAAAAAAGPSEAELAARRKLDEQLQAQAEARIRARAAADAKAEAEARAQAEARARAQAEAEERAARAKRQEYKPPEVDNEPEIATAALPKGSTSASVAKAATQPRGLDMGRTTVIGIIGAGKASRALIRLRNGKVVTVRLGDRIDGGTINSIGDGRLTYVKAGRTHELRMLDGR